MGRARMCSCRRGSRRGQVPYPSYPPVVAPMPPSSTELWRVVNACAPDLPNFDTIRCPGIKP